MNSTPPRTVFEPEFTSALCQIFEEHISFNKVLGLQVTALETLAAEAMVAMRPELIGHFAHHRMHGGVISATLDALGGLAVMAAIGDRHREETPTDRLQRFNKLGTIDLRVDYLRPAVGERFLARAEVLRLGSRVASTRMQFHDAQGRLLSTGSAAYMVS
ncbi:MAG TPA: thioesterase family protein [Burkholderiaceae bacterium]|nr:thioesterase family protein [Burkholderiaceae bacterium]